MTTNRDQNTIFIGFNPTRMHMEKSAWAKTVNQYTSFSLHKLFFNSKMISSIRSWLRVLTVLQNSLDEHNWPQLALGIWYQNHMNCSAFMQHGVESSLVHCISKSWRHQMESHWGNFACREDALAKNLESKLSTKTASTHRACEKIVGTIRTRGIEVIIVRGIIMKNYFLLLPVWAHLVNIVDLALRTSSIVKKIQLRFHNRLLRLQTYSNLVDTSLCGLT